jgi:two-component system, NtrC family, response regulator
MSTPAKRQPLLIVEDDPALQKQMRWALDQYDVLVADDREEAIAQLRRFEPAVVTIDLGLPPQPDLPVEGLKLLEEVIQLAPDTKVIVITGQHDRANALKCVELGAYDFCEKPFAPEILSLIVARAFRLFELQEENRRLHAAQAMKATGGILTRDPQMQKVCRTVERVAGTNATVLLLGESGTGKELLARALHEQSQRRTQRFVAINCAAIPENLLESELFGYEKGAFTGAVKQTLGKLELASGGSLFLDEIGDLPMSLQAKLLRFLQQRVIERVGGREEIAVDVRIVCATHQNLKDLIVAGKFREDLYYRLAEIVLSVPPLRERKGDAALLAHAFVRRFAEEQRRSHVTLAADAVNAIENYGWPGNIRELENRVKSAVIMADSPTLHASDLGLAESPVDSELFNLRRVRDQAERAAVVRVLARVNGNVSRAAELLGISRPTLYDLMEKYGLRE